MSILKALQKHSQAQDIIDIDLPDDSKVVPFDKNGRRGNVAPELFNSNNLRIGSPSSASNGQTEPATGMALLDNRIDTAGATLDAAGSTRSIVHKNQPP
jgi:hypothetical protein